MKIFHICDFDEPFVCSTFGKRIRTKVRLQTHQTSNTEERKHKCEKCPGKTFNTKSELKKHMIYHSDRHKWSIIPPTKCL